MTIFQGFRKVCKEHGQNPALFWKKDHPDPYVHWTFQEYYDNCITFGKALISTGYEKSGAVSVLGFNSRQWFVSLIGAIAAGGMGVGIYTTSLPQACGYVLEHSESSVICVEDDTQRKKIEEVLHMCPKLKCVVQWGGDLANLPAQTSCPDSSVANIPIHSWDRFMELGKDIETSAVEARIDATLPGECASLIYTSGTTGPPKAVMISHDNAVWTSHAGENCMGGGERAKRASLDEDENTSHN